MSSLVLTRSIVGMRAPSLGSSAFTADKQHRAVWAAHDVHAWNQGLSLLPAKYIVNGCEAPRSVRVVALTTPNATLLHTQDTLIAHASSEAVVFKPFNQLDARSVLLVHVPHMGSMDAVPVSIGTHDVSSSPGKYLGAQQGHARIVSNASQAVPVNVEKRVAVYPTQPANPKLVDHTLDTPAGTHAGTLAIASAIIVLVAAAYAARTVM